MNRQKQINRDIEIVLSIDDILMMSVVQSNLLFVLVEIHELVAVLVVDYMIDHIVVFVD
jgi:hypothetical protein